MLKQDEVDNDEEQLKTEANALPAEARKAFYREAGRAVKDPDTYAALNWFFITGLHHFYLGRWGRGALDLALFVSGLIVMFTHSVLWGLGMIALITVLEFWALFRSQIIVQDWNNQVYRRLLDRYRGRH
ncbi:TM2 domain-containing protein [Saccharospirillum salsuginis]|uniref:TM2 domain-containing protein n=1 Tax=Saccharospirillum salsuginis TaxID=418750 RepID=A0A918KD97_9GAMM|nr:TM2 domain-containing protein [Saccharospirillum salsuginis]GGX59179.1 hypothetical protein GCM10007392_28690 [Saccharospirillum salsuginis]